MSYILDALKKAEHQREIGQVPGIGSGDETATVSGMGRRWAWVLLVVLLLNAVLLAFVLWPEAVPLRATATSPPNVPHTQAAPVLPATPQPAPSRQPALSRAASDTLSATPRVPPPLRPLPPLPEPLPVNPTGAPPVVAPASTGPERGTVNVPSPRPVVAGSDQNLPVWPQVSDQLFREIGSALHLDVHVYSDQPAERFVLINVRKYHEGEKLQEGPVVDAITPGGVILSLHGQRFRILSQ